MKTLGFGLKSLLKDPQWAQKHRIDPYNQQGGQVVGDNKMKGAQGAEESIFSRAKKGDVNNTNNIFAQSQNRVNGVNAENNIFAQSKLGGAGNQKTNIFEMMNKFDEQHKALTGVQGMQPMQPIEQMNQMNPEELQKKLGKKLSIFM